ncbi:uncharacterized protein LOC112523039 isoform X2 [Cynara cardunculus var. scolymus]|uniref:uncharacterized protein LOC112523039 isoform X2 n=1 Tax=Cynara cardunculus var. scolymus TaxID=59895 RepID=UPI000D62D206|nr:uncharacterized protein LOC112523039 isoform X2 [Cynara cardunculus var. scolymus]
MEEEMISLRNIMPVELAIKRELEYRKKMDVSRNQRQNDLKPLVLTQVSVLQSQRRVEQKRKVQPYNAQSSRTLMSSTRFVCMVCRMAFATVFHLKMHGETFVHRNKVYLSRKGGENVSNPFVCELCDVSCSTGRDMEFHVAGLKHAACFQKFVDAKRARIHGNLASNQ